MDLFHPRAAGGLRGYDDGGRGPRFGQSISNDWSGYWPRAPSFLRGQPSARSTPAWRSSKPRTKPRRGGSWKRTRRSHAASLQANCAASGSYYSGDAT